MVQRGQPVGVFLPWFGTLLPLRIEMLVLIAAQVFMSLEFYLPLFFQSVMKATPIKSGLYVLPMALCTGVAGVVTGMIIHRSGRFRELIWVGTVVICLGSGLLIMLDAQSTLATALGVQMIVGVGSGLLFQSPLIAVQSSVDQQAVGTATATFGFVRSTAITMSVIVTGIIFQASMNRQHSMLAKAGLPLSVLVRLTGKEAAANVAITDEIADPVQEMAIIQAFAWSMRQMFIATTAFAGLAVVAGLFIKHGHLGEEHTATVTGLKDEKRIAQASKV